MMLQDSYKKLKESDTDAQVKESILYRRRNISFVLAEGGHFRILVMVGGRIRVRKEEIGPESHGFHFPWSIIQGGPWEQERRRERQLMEQRKAKGDWGSAEPMRANTIPWVLKEKWSSVLPRDSPGFLVPHELILKELYRIKRPCFAQTQQWRPSATERKILTPTAERRYRQRGAPMIDCSIDKICGKKTWK